MHSANPASFAGKVQHILLMLKVVSDNIMFISHFLMANVALCSRGCQ